MFTPVSRLPWSLFSESLESSRGYRLPNPSVEHLAFGDPGGILCSVTANSDTAASTLQ